MNISEANDTQTVLRWVLDLTLFEHDPTSISTRTPDDARFVGAVSRLAARSSTTLGAGIGPDDAAATAADLVTRARP